MTTTDIKDLWACPIIPLKMFNDTLGLTTAAGKKFLDAAGAPIFSVGGVDWVRPQDIAHGARAWRVQE